MHEIRNVIFRSLCPDSSWVSLLFLKVQLPELKFQSQFFFLTKKLGDLRNSNSEIKHRALVNFTGDRKTEFGLRVKGRMSLKKSPRQ